MVENRLVGMKSRGVYETPGGTILYKAHNVLETITIDKETQHYQGAALPRSSANWSTTASGSPRCVRLSARLRRQDLQKTVTGDVTLKLYKGNMINAGVTSPYTLYDEADRYLRRG